jgi:hypothetical protein
MKGNRSGHARTWVRERPIPACAGKPGDFDNPAWPTLIFRFGPPPTCLIASRRRRSISRCSRSSSSACSGTSR